MSSNAISLSQQDEPLGFSTLIGGGGGRARGRQFSSASQYLAPEAHEYRRLSAHYPPNLGLTQPVSAYVGPGSSRLEPDPYVRNTYGHRRKHRSHSSSRNRIPEESRLDDSKNHREVGGSSNAISSSHDRLKIEDAGARWSGQQKISGTSRSVSNLSSSSRPPRYSSRNNYMHGSQEHLQTSEYEGSSTHRGSFEGISAAVPAYAVGQALTQPVYPEEGETSMEMGWSRGGGATRPSVKSSRKLKERESKQGGERDVRRTVSLSPPYIVVEGEESNPMKANGEVGGVMAASMATGSTHHPDNVTSSGGNSDNQTTKATSNHEEVPIVWEVIDHY